MTKNREMIDHGITLTEIIRDTAIYFRVDILEKKREK